MPVGGERGAVQNPFLRYAEEAGWTYLTPEQALDLRRGSTSPVLDTVLLEQLQKLNPGIVDYQKAEEIRERLVRVRPTIEGNLTAWEYLKGLKTVFVEVEKREKNVRLLDPVNVEANAFHVTDEFTFSNGIPPDIRTDIMLFINGIPVIVAETKSARKQEGIAEALDDLRHYHRHGPELLALTQLQCLTHLVQFFYGATWNLNRKGLFNWRDEQAGDFETLVKTFVAPRRVLRAVTEFILFTRKDGELEKSVLRPHQMRAVERCVVRARDAEKRRGLIWHTQGSGKTYTMITVAKQLIQDPVFENPTVLMLVDRNELEAQLFANLEAVGFGPVEVAQSKQHLRELLAADRRGLIVSMIHKFDDIPEKINTRANIFVLVDEAHRSTGGELGNYLMGALPHATYLGFTGTPIDKTAYGKGTFKVFGKEDEKGYLDKYSIRESVQDGTTVPLHYQLAPNDLLVDRETLEKEFLDLAEAEGVSDIEELNKVLERAVTLRNMLKNPERVDMVARFVAEHYQSTIEPMGYKAFLVGVDREACALYKEALDNYLPKEYSQVVISTMGKRDPEQLQKYHLTEDQEKDIRKRFRKPDETPKMLIVTEKLLTGFDAPILYCMYLDKPMRDHVLLQAIARVNRPYEDEEGRRKPCGFVLDFVGIFENLEKALAFDSQDVEGVIEGLEVLKERFEQLMNKGREKYLPIPQGLKGDKALEAILEYFRDEERRHEFYQYFRELEELYEIISPDPFMRPFLDDFGELASIYECLRASYERGVILDKSFLRKTEQLVRKHTTTTEIKPPTRLQKLDSDTLAALLKEDQPDTVKVFNLLMAIENLITTEALKEPYLISIGDKAQQIAREFEERQKTTEETLEALRRLIQEIIEARKERDATELSPESFAVYWLLKKEGIEQANVVAKAAEEAFQQYPHWRTSSHQEQEVRRSFYKALINAGVEGVVEIAQGILKMLRRAME
ncbi:MAG: type I restriction endonuclease subunit R [Deltaproteobacteria bacterium]|nr:type I restriction endonuclease subunit R [Deltaproteobacteria bacterium]